MSQVPPTVKPLFDSITKRYPKRPSLRKEKEQVLKYMVEKNVDVIPFKGRWIVRKKKRPAMNKKLVEEAYDRFGANCANGAAFCLQVDELRKEHEKDSIDVKDDPPKGALDSEAQDE